MSARMRAHVRPLLLSCCTLLILFLRLRERVTELRAGSVEAGLEGGNRQVEGLADLLQREVGVVMEEDRKAVCGIELRQSFDKGWVVLREGWVEACCFLLW